MPRPTRLKKTGTVRKPVPPAVARRLPVEIDGHETPAIADVALGAQIGLLTDLLALLDRIITARRGPRFRHVDTERLAAGTQALLEFRTRLHSCRTHLQADQWTVRHGGRRKDTSP